MATDPELIMSSLSLASRLAGRLRGGELQELPALLPWPSHRSARRRSSCC